MPDFPQDATHPVVRVNWEDATAFCEWLTQKEIAAGQLEEGQRYRLPTDLEWSIGAGLPDEGRDDTRGARRQGARFSLGQNLAAPARRRAISPTPPFAAPA